MLIELNETADDFPVIASLGNFDGLHLGHLEILKKLTEIKQNKFAGRARVILVSFYPHPAVVLGKAQEIPKITTLEQSVSLMRKCGIDSLYLIKFTRDLAKLSAEEFIDQYLLGQLNTKYFIIGPDSTFGKDRHAGPEEIQQYCIARNLPSEIVREYKANNQKISSRNVREFISEGKLKEASVLLGRNYELQSRIVAGDGRGVKIGFPTANFASNKQVLPPKGVYAGYLCVDNLEHQAVANIGTRPTFSGEGIRVEVHAIGKKDLKLRGKKANFKFIAKIRDEQKFSSVDDLREQIGKDIEQAKIVLT